MTEEAQPVPPFARATPVTFLESKLGQKGADLWEEEVEEVLSLTLKPRVESYTKSMRLEDEPASEPRQKGADLWEEEVEEVNHSSATLI